MGSGYISSEAVYFVYVETEQAKYHIQQYSSKVTDIVEDCENQDPYVDSIKDGFGTVIQVEIHVPKGTIVSNYQANLAENNVLQEPNSTSQ